LILACSGERLNVGDDPAKHGSGGSSTDVSGAGGSVFGGGTVGTGGSSGGAQAGTGTVPPEGTWPGTEGCDTDPEFEYLLGTWTGDLEDFFLQPVTTLTVVINGASSHGMCGTVTWGQGDPPPPATDVDAAYPSDAYFKGNADGYGGSPATLPPIQAYPYSIAQGAVRAKTVRFATRTFEPWRSWCELQTSYAAQSDSHQCIPDATQYATKYDTDTCTVGRETYSLFKCYACVIGRICQCNAADCDADAGPSTPFALTLSDAGDEMTGPYSGSAYSGALSYYLKHVE
jgi:hypothetical protein